MTCTVKASVARSSPDLAFAHVTSTTHASPSPPLARHLARCRHPRLPSLAPGCGGGCGGVWGAADVLLQNGWTPVFLAAEKGHNAVVEVLIRAGADVNKATTVRRV